MDLTIRILLFIHVLAGVTSLISGPIAMVTQKGGSAHRKWGMVYFWGMLVVFLTGVFVSSVKYNPFLFMIAFFSFYQVFSGYRILFLKKLGNGQQARWMDWLASGISLLSNIVFIIWGVSEAMSSGSFFPKLAIGFGIGGIVIVYNNVKPFIRKPADRQFWWFYHLGNMMGGLIATTTAFSTTIFGMMGISNALVWLWPTIIGVPLINWWTRSYRKKFGLTPA